MKGISATGGCIGGKTIRHIERAGSTGPTCVVYNHIEGDRQVLAAWETGTRQGFGDGHVGRADGGLGVRQCRALPPHDATRSVPVAAAGVIAPERYDLPGYGVVYRLAPGGGGDLGSGSAESPSGVIGGVPGIAAAVVGRLSARTS